MSADMVRLVAACREGADGVARLTTTKKSASRAKDGVRGQDHGWLAGGFCKAQHQDGNTTPPPDRAAGAGGWLLADWLTAGWQRI